MSQTTTITDAQGTAHTYEVIALHRGSEGMRLAMQLSALAIEPLAKALGPIIGEGLPALKGLLGGEGELDRDQVKAQLAAAVLDNPDLLDKLDLPGVGQAVQKALLSVPDATIFAVLRHTNRDGRPLIADGDRPTADFDAAYRGNYGELLQAVVGVARVNGFFPALSTFGAGKKKAPGSGVERLGSGA